jgi:hypothetical protein
MANGSELSTEIPAWVWQERIKITLIHENDNEVFAIFLVENTAGSGHFVLLFREVHMEINGIPTNPSEEQWDALCSMTDEIIMNPAGFSNGDSITVEYRKEEWR